jgi:hypothetical protein
LFHLPTNTWHCWKKWREMEAKENPRERGNWHSPCPRMVLDPFFPTAAFLVHYITLLT